MPKTFLTEIERNPLHELSDVSAASPADADFLIRSASLNKWINAVLASSLDPTLIALADLIVTQGSLITGTGADAFSVLPKGTAGQVLKMNAGATAPEWGTGGGSGGHEIFDAVATQSLVAGDAITVTDGSPYRPVSSSGSITLTSQPTIAAGRDGQLVIVKNVGKFNITLQDVNALGGSLLRMTANALTIQPDGSMALIYDATIGFWIEQWLLNPQTFTPSVSSLTSDLSVTREVAAAATLDTAPNFTIAYVGTPSTASIDVSAGGDPAAQWPIAVPAPFTALNGGTMPPTDTFYRGTTIGSVRIFTVTATVAGHGGLTKILIFTYVNNRFIGSNVKDKTDSLTEAEIEALTTELSNSLTGAFNVTGTNYLWYCYPSRLGVTIFFAIAGEPMLWNNRGLAVTVTNPSGFAETFQQWVSENTGLGAVSVAVTSTLSGSNRIYMGPGPVTDPITNASILALDDTADGESIVSSTTIRTYTAIKIEAGEYLWFCYPDRFTDPLHIKVVTTGIDIDGAWMTNVSHTNQYGYVETYRCWRSANAAIFPTAHDVQVTM